MERNETRRRWNIRVGALLVLLGALTMGACNLMNGSSTLEIGMVEYGGWNEANATFGTLSGTKRWHEPLAEGQTLELDFSTRLDKGSLTLQVVSPEEAVIWELEVTEGESKADSLELVALDAGRYGIVVSGKGAGGSYQLEWQGR
jgi:hypothetical protein